MSLNFVLNLEQHRVLKERRQLHKKELDVGTEGVTTKKTVAALQTKDRFYMIQFLMGEGFWGLI